MRQDVQRPRAELLGECPADAVEHGIAAGQYGDPVPLVGGEQAAYGGPQRRRPRHAPALAAGREQPQLALTADQYLGVQERGACRVRQAGPSVGTDAHHAHDTHVGRELLRGGWFGWCGGHGRYLGVRGMTLPNSTVRSGLRPGQVG